MENASKALLIAGAVLIVILIIGVGMMIYNSSTETINSSTGQMSAQQIQMFNQQFSAYEGESISGTKIKTLLSSISSNTKADDAFVMNFCQGGDIITYNASAEPSSKYYVKFFDSDNDGLLDGVWIKKNNDGKVGKTGGTTVPTTFTLAD